MERVVKSRNILNLFCTEFCEVVERHALYIIVSGFLAIASGRVRGTEDIDMILEHMSKSTYISLHDDLMVHGFVCMQSSDAEEIFDSYLTKKASVRYTLKSRPVPEMEIKFSKDELDDIQLAQRVKIPLTGLDVWFGTIPMNIAFKEHYLKSGKDMEDARHLRLVYDVRERDIDECKKLIQKVRLSGVTHER